MKFINSKEEHPLNKLESDFTSEESKLEKSTDFILPAVLNESALKKFSKLSIGDVKCNSNFSFSFTVNVYIKSCV